MTVRAFKESVITEINEPDKKQSSNSNNRLLAWPTPLLSIRQNTLSSL